MDINEFAQVVLTQQQELLARLYSQAQADNERVTVIPGRVYTKVDVGPAGFTDPSKASSGKFMVENATGIIYGIKAYGKVHKGHAYGTLDTVDEWYWGDYSPVKCVRRVSDAELREGIRATERHF
jgi:hypothetical protein